MLKIRLFTILLASLSFFFFNVKHIFAQGGVYRPRYHRMDLRSRYSHPASMPKHTIFAEAGGNGLYYSVNYDRITYRNMRKTRSYRVGFNYLPRNNYEDRIRKIRGYETSAIFALNRFQGRETHFFEWGVGYTFRWYQGTNIYKEWTNLNTNYHVMYHLLVPSIGYRRQDFGRTPFLRIAFNPIIMYNSTKGSIHFIPYIGFGVGKSFRVR